MNKSLKRPERTKFNSEMYGFRAVTKEDIEKVLAAYPGICWVGGMGGHFFLLEKYVVKDPHGKVGYIPPKYNWNSGFIQSKAYSCWTEMWGDIYA